MMATYQRVNKHIGKGYTGWTQHRWVVGPINDKDHNGQIGFGFSLVSCQIGSFCDKGLCLTTLNYKRVLLKTSRYLLCNLLEFITIFLDCEISFESFERFERLKICICQTSQIVHF